MLTPRRVPLLTPEISRSFGAFRIVNKEKYVMLNEKGLIFCTFCVIISGKAAGWCVKRLEGTFPDIPGERSSMPYSDKTIPPALRATSLFKGGLFPRIMSPLKRGMPDRAGGLSLRHFVPPQHKAHPTGAFSREANHKNNIWRIWGVTSPFLRAALFLSLFQWTMLLYQAYVKSVIAAMWNLG